MKSALKKRRITLWLDQKSERHIQVIAAMFFIGFLLTIAYGFKSLITWSQISQIFFAFAVIYSFIPSNWLPFIYRIRKELKVLLAVCALAPFCTGMVLLLNYHISIHKTIQIEKIMHYKYDYNDQIIIVELNNPEINKHIEIRKFPMDKYRFEPDSAGYKINRGCFGIKTIHDPWLIPIAQKHK